LTGRKRQRRTHYLKDLLGRYHDLTLALAAYNAGPERVDQYGYRVPPYLETMKYVQRIAKSYAKIKAETAAQKQNAGPLSLQARPPIQ